MNNDFNNIYKQFNKFKTPIPKINSRQFNQLVKTPRPVIHTIPTMNINPYLGISSKAMVNFQHAITQQNRLRIGINSIGLYPFINNNIAKQGILNLLKNNVNLQHNILYQNPEVRKTISAATSRNIKSAVAWNEIVNLIYNDSSSYKSSKIIQNNEIIPENLNYKGNKSAEQLKNTQIVPENKAWNPTQASSNYDVDSKQFSEETDEFEEYFSEMAQQLKNDGYNLPTIKQMLLTTFFTFLSVYRTVTDCLQKFKDDTETYVYISALIYALYNFLIKLH